MNAAGVMTALGVTQYKMNPARPSLDDARSTIKRYGVVAAGELLDWDIGPYCDNSSCRIPYGIEVGNDNIPVNVLVAFRHGQVTEIDVSFGALFWDEILPILSRKYGSSWEVERSPMVITDLETKKKKTLERITLTHKLGGRNPKTTDTCQIWVTNLDMVFQHHDVLGPYHSMFVVKLVSTNF